VCLSHLVLLVQASKRSRIKVEEYIFLLKIRKVIETNCRTKARKKKKKNYTNRDNNNKTINIEETSLSLLFDLLCVQESTIIKSKEQLSNILNHI